MQRDGTTKFLGMGAERGRQEVASPIGIPFEQPCVCNGCCGASTASDDIFWRRGVLCIAPQLQGRAKEGFVQRLGELVSRHVERG